MDQRVFSPPINIGHWVRKWASLRPQKPAVILEDSVFTYQQLNSRVNQISNLLHEMGVRKGDRVAVLLYNSNVYIEIYFALAKLGAILVPLNLRLKGSELEFILKDSGSETLILGEEFLNVVTSLKPNVPVKEANYIGVGETFPPWVVNYEKAIETKSRQEPQVRGVIGWEDHRRRHAKGRRSGKYRLCRPDAHHPAFLPRHRRWQIRRVPRDRLGDSKNGKPFHEREIQDAAD